MHGGAKTMWFVACLGAAGCAAQSGELKIRPIADPSAKFRAGSDKAAVARGQLALGNVGLAIEGFRKALREQPNSAEAYAGLAACYDEMGRYDLARSNYEAALAIAPKDPALLTALAVSLERQGDRESAVRIRGEVAELASAAAALEAPDIEPTPVTVVPRAASSVTVALPAPRAADTPVVSPMRLPPASVAIAHSPLDSLGSPIISTIRLPVLGEPLAPAPTREAEAPVVSALRMTEASLTIALPAAGALQTPALSLDGLPVASVPIELPAAKPAETPVVPTIRQLEPTRVVVSLPPATLAPRLERLTLGEVALVTGGGPVWRTKVVSRTAQSATLRFVPIRTASLRPNIRVLNAARSQGLAARTRTVLIDRGWRRIEIGDASRIRERSLVLYPASRQALGRSLAAQFGFPAVVTGKSSELVVLLGRDAPGIRAARSRG